MNQDIEKWNRVAKEYSQKIEKDPFREKFLYPLILESLGPPRGKKILDVGCASGVFSRILAKNGAFVFAIDGSPKIIEIAKKIEEKKPLGIEYKIADLNQQLNYKKNFFDSAVAIHILMDIQNLKMIFSELSRVLKPGGKLVISVSHPCFTRPALHWKKGVLGRMNLKWGHGRVSDYFPKRKVDKLLSGINSPIPHYHRLLEDYVKGLISAGFIIRDLEEPRMPADLAKKTDFFLGDRIPMVLILVASKVS